MGQVFEGDATRSVILDRFGRGMLEIMLTNVNGQLAVSQPIQESASKMIGALRRAALPAGASLDRGCSRVISRVSATEAESSRASVDCGLCNEERSG